MALTIAKCKFLFFIHNENIKYNYVNYAFIIIRGNYYALPPDVEIVLYTQEIISNNPVRDNIVGYAITLFVYVPFLHGQFKFFSTSPTVYNLNSILYINYFVYSSYY